jgi:hypothetical protein
MVQFPTEARVVFNPLSFVHTGPVAPSCLWYRLPEIKWLWHLADHTAPLTPLFVVMVWTGATLLLTGYVALSMHKKVCQSLEN